MNFVYSYRDDSKFSVILKFNSYLIYSSGKYERINFALSMNNEICEVSYF